MNIVNELQCLRQDDAIKCVRGDVIASGEIRHNGGTGQALLNVKYIALRNLSGPEFIGIGVISYLQDTPPYVCRMSRKELMDIVAVDRQAGIVIPVCTERPCASQHSKMDRL